LGFGDEILLPISQPTLPSVSLASAKLTETLGSWRLEIATPPSRAQSPTERRNVASRGSVDCP